MKELLQQFAAFHLWANQRMVDCLHGVPEEVLHQELASSFPTLHLTLLHLWNVESIWWQRLRLQEYVSAPGDSFKGTTRDLGAALLHQSSLWYTWVQNASEPALQHVFHYHDNKKELFKQPVSLALMQIFNHATFHRGQMVTMLRQAGITKIPNTDLITWSRSKK